MKKLKLILLMFLIIFTIIFLADLLNTLKFNKIIIYYEGINPIYVIIAFLFNLFMNFLRSIRVKKIFPKKITSKTSFVIISYNNFLNYIIPYRLGELSYLYFLNEEKIDIPRNINSFILLKTTDFLFKAIFLILMVYIGMLFYPIDKIFIIISSFLFVFIIILIISLLNLNKILQLISYKIKNFENVLLKKFYNLIVSLNEDLEYFKNLKNKKSLFLTTIFIIILQSVVVFFIFFSFSLNISYFVIILGELAVSFILLIPASLLGNFGFQELSFSYLVSSEISDYQSAYNITFIWHFIAVIFSLIIFIFGISVKLHQKYFKKENCEKEIC